MLQLDGANDCIKSTVKNSAFRVSSSSNDTVSRESSGHLETSPTAFFGASFGLTQLPGGVKPENLMPTLSERPVALTAMSDAAAATAAAVAYDSRIIGATPYYNSGYPSASYAGMYAAGGTQNYYPVVSSSLRGTAAAAAATSFPFAAAAASHAYYGNGYTSAHFDYTSYPATMHCYGGRSGYYGCSINPVSSNSSLYAMNSLANDVSTSNQLSSFNTKHETKRSNKATKRKKNPGGTNSPEKQYKRAFIWEMEDVCVLSNFFLRSNDPIRNERLAEMINNNVNRLITSIFGIDQDDQDCEYVNIEDANIDDTFDNISYSTIGIDTPSTSTMGNTESSLLGHARGGVDWMRKLAVKYQHIKDTYNSYKNNFAGLLERTGNTERAELLALKSTMDPLAQGWGESVGQCLKLIIDRSSREHYANILLTGENIVSTLAKLLIMEQSSMIPAENVYSIMKIGKEAVIDRILSHFGKKCSFVIISTHLDTHEIAKKENIPLWKVKSVRDLDLFHLALNHHLLS
uniref:Eyes absent homolog n=2 Tax=Wuchereria bancrofti TaxID=6293 RepID=A0AAF5Q1J0_WUCBA